MLATGLLVTALLAAGCGADEQAAEPSPAPPPPAATGEPPVDETKATAGMQHDPAPGRTLLRFVQAAAANDAATMWALLSTPSRERLGPTRAEFDARFATEFRDGVGTFADSPDLVMVTTGSDENGWGIAAVAGEREREGELEYAAYASALRMEGGRWRLELGAPIELRRLVDTPPATLEVQVAANDPVEAAGLWIDGEPLRASVRGDDAARFVIHAERLQLQHDRHVGVTFARTADTAAAGAFPLAASESA
jgi:hypothetical protein